MPHRHDLQLLSHHIVSRLSSNPCLTLTELSKELAVDRHILERAVREILGIRFRQLKKDARFTYACTLLKTLSVKEAANALGMTHNSLSRFIKALTGKPPTRHKW